MKPREHSRFAFELFAKPLIGKQRFFQCDCCVKSLINRLINRAHSSLTQLSNYSISTLKNCLGIKHWRFSDSSSTGNCVVHSRSVVENLAADKPAYYTQAISNAEKAHPRLFQ